MLKKHAPKYNDYLEFNVGARLGVMNMNKTQSLP